MGHEGGDELRHHFDPGSTRVRHDVQRSAPQPRHSFDGRPGHCLATPPRCPFQNVMSSILNQKRWQRLKSRNTRPCWKRLWRWEPSTSRMVSEWCGRRPKRLMPSSAPSTSVWARASQNNGSSERSGRHELQRVRTSKNTQTFAKVEKEFETHHPLLKISAEEGGGFCGLQAACHNVRTCVDMRKKGGESGLKFCR